MKKPKRIPHFRSAEEEARFWETHSLADYWEETEPAEDVVFVRPPSQVVTLRLERPTVQRLKAIAHKRGLRYSTLLRSWIVERLGEGEPAAIARRGKPRRRTGT